MNQLEINYVINILRKGTITSPQRKACLKKARKKVLEGHTEKGKPKYKYHWQCATCRQWSRNINDLEIDHIKEIGPFKGDWNYFIQAMYCHQDNLQALCVLCHSKKTAVFSAQRAFTRKVKNDPENT